MREDTGYRSYSFYRESVAYFGKGRVPKDINKLDVLLKDTAPRDVYGATLLCGLIARTISHSNGINKERAYSDNKKRATHLRNEARQNYNETIDRRTLNSRVLCSWMLHDYGDLRDILKDRTLGRGHLTQVKNMYARLNIPTKLSELEEKYIRRQAFPSRCKHESGIEIQHQPEKTVLERFKSEDYAQSEVEALVEHAVNNGNGRRFVFFQARL